ncbi:PTS IIA-like nitrogen regulatory protein PtsN [Fulvimarina sp. 2208YS6-2-32]|uniref:PTS IIA-like nitrogen regulatory protein PtsN n=1 Tax=Fulvimarina uroteuthidis TaxID=3098149 RepID=A0ABU5HYF7_9HYPH|nr:PTS IIA-like nitrogen regulatory protein PtsN [Fulvimarina sp. 2208YS6-2-32]MDY8108127.1 PTS IIA-like nitrogen regulatory protein PtsN [Fulvimarina sp. 2208YS6-2-32]
MDFQSLIEPAAIMPALKATSKRQVLQEMATKASELIGRPEREILETILGREKLGSTGVGNGIAIPHGRLPGLTRITGAFARLQKPIDFDALDEEPVDLVFLLLAPENSGADHLKALSKVARLLRDPETVASIRGLQDAGSIFSAMVRSQTRNAA